MDLGKHLPSGRLAQIVSCMLQRLSIANHRAFAGVFAQEDGSVLVALRDGFMVDGSHVVEIRPRRYVFDESELEHELRLVGAAGSMHYHNRLHD